MKKFSYIEVLRLFTALSVVLYHYIHFFSPFSSISNFKIMENKFSLPFFSFLEFIYDNGRYGVEMFWTISGFVFAFVYLNKSNKISSKDFFINRFCRLYPLHLLTLLIVAFLQIISMKLNGSFQIYNGNDFYHFIINLFFVNGWGFSKIPSFNNVTWSVSIELIIYFIFFISIIYLNKFNFKFIICVYIILLFLDKNFEIDNFYKIAFFDCCRLFFSGILVYYLYIKVDKKFYLYMFSTILICASFIGSLKIFILFPSIVLFLALLGTPNNLKLRSFLQANGDLTYALYLLHIPTQILIILIIGHFNISYEIFLNKYFFIFYIFLLIFISHLSFKFFENPLNYGLRRKLKNE